MKLPLHRVAWLLALLLGTFRSHAASPDAAAIPRSAPNASEAAPWRVFPPLVVPDATTVLPHAPALVHALGNAADLARRFRPPSRPETWARRRDEVASAFRRTLGLEPLPPRTPLNARIIATHEFGSVVIENLVFESRPGFPVSANLYRPTRRTGHRLPAVVSPIGHFLTAGKTATQVQARCLGLAERGAIVLTYDAIGQGERLQMGNIHHEAGYALLPLGETVAGWMVWDTLRALDYLVSRDDVDANRLGITGNSGGGLNTLFAAAVEPRLSAAVVAGFTFEFADWIRYGGTHCTCTHLPGLLDSMEWFEIAGLIAPRPLLLLQGERDTIFPIQGAARAARDTETLYQLSGDPAPFRFVMLPAQPHAYTEPFREHLYSWMSQWLTLEGPPPAAGNPPQPPLPENDPRLLCDPERSWMPKAPTVIDLARATALRQIARLPSLHDPAHQEAVSNWVHHLITAPEPDLPAPYLAPRIHQAGTPDGQVPEKCSIVPEPGVLLPGLIWQRSQPNRRNPVLLVLQDQGKARVAESGLVPPLVNAGYAVVSFDLRGRGETSAHHSPRHDIQFRLIASQILSGKPLPGRRAFDVRRIVDYLHLRPDLDASDLTVIGLGDDALPVILAAGADPRIQRIAIADFYPTLAATLQARPLPDHVAVGEAWNDPQLDGRIHAAFGSIDLGSVIPGALHVTDMADLIRLLAPRPVLARQFRDIGTAPPIAPALVRLRDAFRSPTANRSEYSPEAPLTAEALLNWLQRL